MALPIAALFGGAAAASGLGLGLFGKRKTAQVPDISSELARIDAIIGEARQRASQAINIEAQAARGNVANVLASRGVYQSPVAAHNFGALEQSRLAALARSDADILGQGAGLRAGLLGQMAGLRYQASRESAESSNQRTAGFASGLAGLGSSLLFFNPASPAATTAPQAPYYLARQTPQDPFFASGRAENIYGNGRRAGFQFFGGNNGY